MTLTEISQEYRINADQINRRISQLEEEIKQSRDPKERSILWGRTRILSTMLRESQELAVLTARYYDRGYRRNVKYTL